MHPIDFLSFVRFFQKGAPCITSVASQKPQPAQPELRPSSPSTRDHASQRGASLCTTDGPTSEDPQPATPKSSCSTLEAPFTPDCTPEDPQPATPPRAAASLTGGCPRCRQARPCELVPQVLHLYPRLMHLVLRQCCFIRVRRWNQPAQAARESTSASLAWCATSPQVASSSGEVAVQRREPLAPPHAHLFHRQLRHHPRQVLAGGG